MKSKIYSFILTFIYISKTIYCSSLNITSIDIVNERKIFNLPLYNKTSELIDNAYIKNETKIDEKIRESSSNFGIRIMKPPNLKALEIDNKLFPVKNLIKNDDEKKQTLSSKLNEQKKIWNPNENLKDDDLKIFKYKNQLTHENKPLNNENYLKHEKSPAYTFSYTKKYYPIYPKKFKKFKTYENNFEYHLPNKNHNYYPSNNFDKNLKEKIYPFTNSKSFRKLIKNYKNNNYIRNNINKYDYNDLNIGNNFERNQLSYQDKKNENDYLSKFSKNSKINFSNTNSVPIIIRNIDYDLFFKMNPHFDHIPNHFN